MKTVQEVNKPFTSAPNQVGAVVCDVCPCVFLPQMSAIDALTSNRKREDNLKKSSVHLGGIGGRCGRRHAAKGTPAWEAEVTGLTSLNQHDSQHRIRHQQGQVHQHNTSLP
uniref:Uncharacterized protein n=1 Tax=Mesocestoides corti TaxID=53468 RepID=A0A5K3ELD1_MESCO